MERWKTKPFKRAYIKLAAHRPFWPPFPMKDGTTLPRSRQRGFAPIAKGAFYPRLSRSGFTLIELMVVVAVIAILAAILLPALGGSRQRAQGIQCLNNLKQLQIAWGLYADEHEQHLPPNSDQPPAGRDLANASWVAGWLRNELQTGSKFDGTNTDLLIGASYVPFGSIGQHIKEAKVYLCPGDKSRVTIDGQSFEHVRTVSMNCYMNGNGIWQSSNFITFRKSSDILTPSEKWVFLDERDDSINDGYFAVDMTKTYSIIDVPANFHNRGGNLTFADGHADYHQWLESTTQPPHSNGGHLPGLPAFTSANDRDLAWLTRRTTTPK